MKIAKNFLANHKYLSPFYKTKRSNTPITRTFLIESGKKVKESAKKPKAILQEVKILQRGTKENFTYNGSFQEAISPVLVLSQIFAVMPVFGIKSKNAEDIRFAWLSFRTIYSLCVFFGLTLYTLLTLYWAFDQQIMFANFVPIIFNICCVAVIFSFLRLAQKWSKLMLKWQSIEKILPAYKTQSEKAYLANRIKIITFVTLTLSLTEHMLNIIADVHTSNTCTKSATPIKDFFITTLQPLFHWTEYSPLKALYGKTINVYATFIWTYTDLFVMLMSVGLSTRFKQVDDCLFAVKGQSMPETFWHDHRQYYRKLANLCADVDQAISSITVVSFSNNLYFICVQLLKSMKRLPSFAHAFYFWFSLVFLIGRTLAVSLYAAGIHDESKRPIEVLRAIPRDSWCTEAKRFSEEVNNNTVALSGMNFFYLTRNLVLSVAGTIVTYELVLIQFQENQDLVSACD